MVGKHKQEVNHQIELLNSHWIRFDLNTRFRNSNMPKSRFRNLRYCLLWSAAIMAGPKSKLAIVGVTWLQRAAATPCDSPRALNWCATWVTSHYFRLLFFESHIQMLLRSPADLVRIRTDIALPRSNTSGKCTVLVGSFAFHAACPVQSIRATKFCFG